MQLQTHCLAKSSTDLRNLPIFFTEKSSFTFWLMYVNERKRLYMYMFESGHFVTISILE